MNERSSLFLMANLGAEVSRIFSAKEKGEVDMVRGASDRAYKIIDKVQLLADMQAREDEIKLLKQAIEDIGREEPVLNVKPEKLKEYFIPFATRLLS